MDSGETAHLKIIGAGLPRAATLTQKTALEMLGFGPCHHMTTALASADLMSKWISAHSGTPDWDSVYDGFNATVDWPGSYYYRELAEAYPDAKVLLSARSGESWARSVGATIWDSFFGDSVLHHLMMAQFRTDPARKQFLEMILDMFTKTEFLGPDPRNYDPEAAAASMERHNAEVRESIPSHRLLEWWPTDGWEPLCEFLEVPVPAEPVPNTNNAASYTPMLTEMCIGALNAWFSDGAPAVG